MTQYDFTLVLDEVDDLTAHHEDAIHAAGCGDATVSRINGIVHLDFTREGTNRLDVIRCAIRQLYVVGLFAQLG